MGAALIIVLLPTMAVGVVLLGFWSAPSGQRGDRRSAAIVTAHVGGAALVAITSITYAISGRAALGVAAIVAVVATMMLGTSAFASSRTRRPVPAAVLVIHGAFAVAMLAVVVTAVVRGST